MTGHATAREQTAPTAGEQGARRRVAQAVVVGLPVAALAVAVWDPARHGGPSMCPWRAVTGVACPGCGLTRAVGALLRGRVGDALELHPFVLVVALECALVWIAAAVALRRGRERTLRSPNRPGTSSPRWVMPAAAAANVALLLGIWGARAMTGTLPPA